MPKPLSLQKGDQVVHNVYPSEVAYWASQGWGVVGEPPAEPVDPITPVPFEPEPETIVIEKTRYQELTEANWRDIRALATEYDLSRDDGESWHDLIPQILEKESQ